MGHSFEQVFRPAHTLRYHQSLHSDPIQNYPPTMPWGLKRYQNTGTLHFVTFSCYRRQPLLRNYGAAELFERALEQARLKYGFLVIAYVVIA